MKPENEKRSLTKGITLEQEFGNDYSERSRVMVKRIQGLFLLGAVVYRVSEYNGRVICFQFFTGEAPSRTLNEITHRMNDFEWADVRDKAGYLHAILRSMITRIIFPES